MIKQDSNGQTFTKGHKHATTKFSEANAPGAVPPKIHLPESEFASESDSMDDSSL